MTQESEDRGAEAGRPPRPEEPGEPSARARFELLRAVYPLNPGIPHWLDFPGGRE